MGFGNFEVFCGKKEGAFDSVLKDLIWSFGNF